MRKSATDNLPFPSTLDSDRKREKENVNNPRWGSPFSIADASIGKQRWGK
jgi:hypothetical protein